MATASPETKLHEFEPIGTNRSAFLDRSPELLLTGPAGTGKSRALLEKLHFSCMLTPNIRCLIVRKTHASLQSSALVTWRMYVIAEALLNGDVEYYGGSAKEAGYYYRNGSLVVTGGLDKPTKIMSTEWDLIYVQEAIELVVDDWEALTSRLRNGRISYQQLLADTNPTYPTHWLKQRVDSGQVRELTSRHEDNPILFDNKKNEYTKRGKEYIALLDRLTGVRYLRLRKGQWAAAEGIIYEDFDEASHLIDSVRKLLPEGTKFQYIRSATIPADADPEVTYVDKYGVPLDWPRYWAVDFGFTNPFVWQCWTETPDGMLVLYREIYRTKRTVEQHAQRIKSIVLQEKSNRDEPDVWIEPPPHFIVCDHDAEGRAQLEGHFGATRPAHKAVAEGIEACQNRYKNNRIRIVRGCRIDKDPALSERKLPTSTEEELGGYVWADKKQDTPVKENDHGMDGKRYLVAERDLKGGGEFFRGWF